MSVQPMINGKAIERAYEDYRLGMYLVNRRYQRKLVWSIKEKRAFIDSLINGYPVPLFLFSASIFKDIARNEIIDGMQRLNAVFSFIENEFSLEDGKYFDLSSTAITKDLLDRGLILQKGPTLERPVCVKIVSYELPFSTYNETDSRVIDEVFRRINSNGQHLSKQEIRQAGATSEFAQLVRKLSTQIRGDVSHADILLLSDMKDISLQQDDSMVGIDASYVFWVKENIINKEDLRQSLDEELVADLLAAMVLNPIPPSNVSVLDEYYGFKTVDSETREQRIEEAIMAINPELLSNQFIYVLDQIKNLFHGRPHSIGEHVFGSRVYRAPRYFQILFLAMYEILIKREKKISDYDMLYRTLAGIAGRTMNVSGGGGWWSSKEKGELIVTTAAAIENSFINRSGDDPMYYSYTTELETILRQSHTENNQYDFKQGVYDLISGRRNEDLLSKIFKTLTAMANSEKNAIGYILLGVADKQEDAKKIEDKYGICSIKVGTYYVTGINGEVDSYHSGNYNDYLMMLRNALSTAPISDHYRRQIGSKARMINYHGNSVVILRIVNDNGAAIFDKSYYMRSCASNDPVPVAPEDMPAFFAKFH